jgi:hypothetical protein
MIITNLFFKAKETNFKIIGTESLGKSLEDTQDTILNLDNGKISKIMRKDLIKYL